MSLASLPLWVVALVLGLTGWLWWLRRARHRESILPAAINAVPPWHDLMVPLLQKINGPTSRAQAVDLLAESLQSELGAQGIRVLRIRAIQGDKATVQALPSDSLLGEPPSYVVSFNESSLGRAIASMGVAGGSEIGFALAWPGMTLEFASIGLPLSDEAILQLLEVLHGVVSMADAPSVVAAAGGQWSALDPQIPAQVVDFMPSCVLMLDPVDLRVLGLNRAARTEFGLEQDVVGKSLAQVFGVSVATVAEPDLRRAHGQEGMVQAEYEWLHPRGHRTLQASHQCLQTAQGRPWLLVSVFRDVTAERQIRHDLRETQSRFLEFSEAMEDSLFIADPERRCFQFLAGGTLELWGVTSEQAARGDFFVNILDEDRPLLEERMRCERALLPADFVFRVRHPIKGLTFVRTRTRTSLTPDGSKLVFGVASDVTKDQVREEQLRAALDAAEAASLAKSQFMATMSHEIRTPMNGILGMTELLLNTVLDERQRRCAESVYRSGEGLMTALGDILEFTRLDAGQLELVNADFDVQTAVEDTLELLAPMAHQRRLELNFRESHDVPGLVHGDSMRFRQILSKFVGNAIKFTNSGEVIVDVRAYPLPAKVWLLETTITDTGIGIDPVVLPGLFRAFSQVSGGLSRQHGGVGLGLATAGRLAQLMGGSVDVRSTPGVGSVFTFKLPFEEAVAVPEPWLPSQSTAEACRPQRVLLVEDHPTSRQVLRAMLEEQSCVVTEAHDGLQALELLAGSDSSGPGFDLALIDFDMPHLNGVVLANRLRAERRCPHMKLVLLAGSTTAEDIQRARDVGFDRLMAKPVRRSELSLVTRGMVAPAADIGQNVPRMKGRVLVIEDNRVNQEVIGQMLRNLHLDVRIAGSALHGLRALCEAHFDLILMDIMMPGMDGIEALGWFRQGGNQRFQFVTPTDAPVVAVTANALVGDEDRFLSLGFSGYLSKPLRQSQLVNMLSKHLSVNTDSSTSTPIASMPPNELPGSTLLDPHAMDRLKELDPRGENNLVERVISAFLQSVDRLIPQLEQARQTADLAGVRHVAHTFKSSSASIGATKLSGDCADLEALIRMGKVANLDQRVFDLCNEVALVSQALQNLLGRQT